MATSAATLIQQTRRYLRDWRDWDFLNASVNTSLTSFTVSDTSIYARRWFLEVDQEIVQVTSLASSTVLIGRRGMLGTTAASHASGTSVLVRPQFYSVEILDALNEGIQACFPAIYKPVVASVSGSDSTYAYSIPDMPSYTGYPIPYIYRVEIKQSGDTQYRQTRRFEIVRGTGLGTTTPAIKFMSPPMLNSNIRLRGYGPFPKLTSTTDTLDSLFPPQAEYLLPLYAAGNLLMSGEAGRVRSSTGAVDDREQANRVGASLQVGTSLWQRFRNELLNGSAAAAMPPLPRHSKSRV